MIRVEQDMLVLDSTISKKDVQAINEFLEITKRQERERIIKSLQDNYWHDIYYPPQERYATKPSEELIMAHTQNCIGCELITRIKGEK